ncbi:MAG: Ldh family oxidoreductase [Pseudomonadota bacterium]
MTGPTRLSLDAAQALLARALERADTSPANAAIVAAALVRAEADGQRGHGLSRLPSYAAQSRVGKVDGHAEPRVEEVRPAALRIDAAHGFAYPAMAVALPELGARARTHGIAAAAIHRSHHFGVAGHPCEDLAAEGLAAFIYGNSPRAIAPAGAARPLLGTNPIAFAAPMAEGPPLVIDLALSRVARGKILAAQKAGETIPEGWALDPEGQPTTDPAAAIAGSMIAIGEAKGAALALMVEVMAAALAGAQFGFEASSLMNAEGGPPAIGQTILAVDVSALSGGAFGARMGDLAAAYAEVGARLPGTRRLAARAAAEREGIAVAPALLAEIQALAE